MNEKYTLLRFLNLTDELFKLKKFKPPNFGADCAQRLKAARPRTTCLKKLLVPRSDEKVNSRG